MTRITLALAVLLSVLLINDGARFDEALPDVILKHDASHGVQFVDFDADGRLDLALSAFFNPARGVC